MYWSFWGDTNNTPQGCEMNPTKEYNYELTAFLIVAITGIIIAAMGSGFAYGSRLQRDEEEIGNE